MDTAQLKRIADAMEEILRLVKADQAQSQAQREKDEELDLFKIKQEAKKKVNAKEKN